MTRSLETRDRHRDGRDGDELTTPRRGGPVPARDVARAARPDPRVLPATPVTRFAPAPDRRPPPRAPRQRAVHVGHRAGDRRARDPADRGPRPAAVAAGVRGDAPRRPRAAGSRPRRAARRGVPRRADAVPPVGRRGRVRGRARAAARGRARLRVRVLASDVRGVRGGARPAVARHRLPRRLPASGSPRGRGHGPAGGRRGRLGALDRPAGGADGRRARGDRRPPGPRPARQLDVRAVRGRRRHAARRRPRRSAAATCSTRRPSSSGSPACSVARRRRHSFTTRSSGAPRARSSQSPRATRRCARCSTQAGPPPSCSASPPAWPVSCRMRRRSSRTASGRCSASRGRGPA